MVDLFNKTSIKYVTTNPEWKFLQKGLSKNANVTAHVQNDRDDHALHGDHASGSVHHLQKYEYINLCLKYLFLFLAFSLKITQNQKRSQIIESFIKIPKVQSFISQYFLGVNKTKLKTLKLSMPKYIEERRDHGTVTSKMMLKVITPPPPLSQTQKRKESGCIQNFKIT